MAFDFPSAPTIGQVYEGFSWDGEKWLKAAVGSAVHVGSTPPGSPANGAQWFDTETGQMFVWYDDGSSAQWVSTASGVSSGDLPEAPADGLSYTRRNAAWSRVRTRATDNMAIYVAPTGNDANDGLTPATAVATIQKGVSRACEFDLGDFEAAVYVADGNYAGPINIRPYIGKGPITIYGNIVNPGNVIVTGTNTDAFKLDSVVDKWIVRGLKVTTVGATGCGFFVINVSQLTIGNIDFGPCIGSHIEAQRSYVDVYQPCHTSGGALCHYNVACGGIFDSGNAHTSAGAINFGLAYASAGLAGVIYALDLTFGGATFTGTRYTSTLNSVIHTGSGSNPNYFPGNAPGSSVIGGIYV